MSLAVLDANDDGLPDLLVANDTQPNETRSGTPFGRDPPMRSRVTLTILDPGKSDV